MKKITAILLAVVMTLSVMPFFTAAAESLDEGLVLRYTFDSDSASPSSITDDSGNGNNATVLNNSQSVDTGWGQSTTYTKNLTVENGAAVFPGVEQIRGDRGRPTTIKGAAIKIPASAFDGIEDYTVSMWVKADSSYSYASQLQRFFDFGTGTKDSIFYRYTASTGESRFQDRGLGNSADDDASLVSLTNSAFNDAWGLLTVTYEKNTTTLTIYINGEQVLTDESKFTRSIGDLDEVTDDTYGYFLGRTQWYSSSLDTNPDFKGSMDDVRIYNRALSADEAALLYESTNPDGEKIPKSAQNPDDVLTTPGIAPSLPSTVKVTYTNGSSEKLAVTWDEIPEESYASDGSFTVNGTVDDTELTVSVTVNVVSDPKESIKSGLALYYSFDTDAAEPTTITDMSGNGNDATVLNTTGGWTQANNKLAVEDGIAVFPGFTQTTFEEWGGYTETDNGAALKLPNDFNQAIDGNYTVSMWVKADGSYSFADKGVRLFDFGNRGSEGTTYTDSIFASLNTSGGTQLMLRDRKLDATVSADLANSEFIDKWSLLTVVYSEDDSAADIYVNGKLLTTNEGMTRTLSDIGTLDDTSNGMFIGRNQWYSDWSQSESNPDFKGSMDEIRIYSRTLSEDEIAALYELTNPERTIPVTVKTVIAEASGGKLDESTVETISSTEVEVAEDSSYSVTPDETLTVDGKTYTFSEALSTTEIDSVSDDNCEILLVYVELKPESAEAVEVEEYKGNVPLLPDTVEVTYNTGDTESVAAEWDEIPAEKYASANSFAVNGTAAGLAVTATVTIYEIASVQVSENVYTSWGSAPTLPQNAKVVFSHKPDEEALETIVWDEISDETIAAGVAFTVNGYLQGYPDVTVSTTVSFVYEAVTSVEAVADTYTSNQSSGNGNYGSEEALKITYKGGSGPAGYNRYAFLRFTGAPENTLGATLKIFVQYIENNRNTTYTLYALASDKTMWDETALTWNTQDEYIADAEALDSVTLSPSTKNEWLEFDITSYITENPSEEYYSFYISCDTCATYANSRESGENVPTIEYATMGQPVVVNYVYGDKVVSSETVMAQKGAEFTVDGDKAFVSDGEAYVVSGDIPSIDSVDENNCTLDVPLEKTDDITFEAVSVSCYYDEAPVFPSTVTAMVGGEYEVSVPVEFTASALDSIGVYTVSGTAEGFDVSAEVKAYGRYYDEDGKLLGYASQIVYNYVDDGETVAEPVTMLVQTGTALDSDEMLDYYPQLADGTITEGVSAVTEPIHEVTISGTKVDGVSGRVEGSISGDSSDAYTLSVDAVVANTGTAPADAKLIIAKYASDGTVASVKTETVSLEALMTGIETITASIDYNRDANDIIRAYLWEADNLRPLDVAITASELSEYSEEVLALIPTYDEVKENVERANSYRQSTWAATDWVNGIHPAFWDTAAYHTGNMEAYFTFGNEEYKQYSTDWAENNNWSGNTYSGDKENWTWSYNQSQGSNAVLFGDWQICFQSYLDLNLLDPDETKIARTTEVMSYQITKDEDAFWWWADSLYMVTPVMTKMYLTTGNEDYLDAMYKYYKYAAELMYDGEEGIPTSADGYTTSAALKSGAQYSDADNYAHLFFRDASYVYPLNPLPDELATTKNFWARGNGWVFAGLAKVLADMPSDYEHYNFFLTIYTQMAKAIIDCQQVDSDGNGFWTQSMLADYPKGNNNNDEGYETSGTAFFTYGLFWGLNSGVLGREKYLEPALRAWRYLSKVALLDNGAVGYCQPVGSEATDATPKSTTQPFGFGAFLLAGSEVSRWVGGVTESNLPYLMRKMWGSVAVNGSKYFVGGEVVEGSESFTQDGELYVPASEFAGYLGLTATETDDGIEINDELNEKSGVVQSADVVEKDGVKYVPVSSIASIVGKHVLTTSAGVTIVSHKTSVFYDCDENSESYLNELLN